MTSDLRRSCVVCAWRSTCAKQFTMGDDALHCPDFTEDVQLRRQSDSGDAKKDTH